MQLIDDRAEPRQCTPRGAGARIERPPAAYRGPISCSGDGRGGAIRTLDLLNPIQVRYQAAPRPDGSKDSRRPGGDGVTRLVGP